MSVPYALLLCMSLLILTSYSCFKSLQATYQNILSVHLLEAACPTMCDQCSTISADQYSMALLNRHCLDGHLRAKEQLHRIMTISIDCRRPLLWSVEAGSIERLELHHSQTLALSCIVAITHTQIMNLDSSYNPLFNIIHSICDLLDHIELCIMGLGED